MLQQLTNHASFDLPFVKYDGPAIVTIPLLLGFLVAFFSSYIWLYYDARKRGKKRYYRRAVHYAYRMAGIVYLVVLVASFVEELKLIRGIKRLVRPNCGTAL